MPKILVADDNSNIQKMVGLALKDQGIDVVAVGNGEAAVRKISDVRPDLVLADVFMPVRNGYEVCQYVKGDSGLSHIPVILLVGAFDPLDEQEAQRVGADGVLKKPFVPPDPLISMVKSALARAGVSLGGPPPPKEEPVQVAQMIAPRSLPSMSSMTPAELPPAESEPVEAVSAQPEPVKIEAGSQPLAFGNLLETPAEQEQVDDAAFATTARPDLERDWNAGRDENEEPEEEEEEEPASSWRRDAGDEAIEQEQGESSNTEKDWRETAFSEGPARKSRVAPWTPQHEISSLDEAAETEQRVGATVTEMPSAASRISQEPVPAFQQDAWAAVTPKTVEAVTMEPPAPAKIEAPEVHEPAAAEIHQEPAGPTAVNGTPSAAAEPAQPAARDNWFSAVSSPWDAEIQKASKLASTWDEPAASAPVATEPEPAHVDAAEPVAMKEDANATVDSLPTSLSQETTEKVAEAALPATTVEAIRDETRTVAETAVQEAPVHETGSKSSEPSMEELVAKVLAKMSPDMLQAVTREILKPVVESMVRDELNSKK